MPDSAKKTGWLASLAVSRSERAPTAEELYSDGPHAATRAYEIGDPELGTEVGTGLELTLRSTTDRFEGSASLFWTRFDDFIYLADTVMVERSVNALFQLLYREVTALDGTLKEYPGDAILAFWEHVLEGEPTPLNSGNFCKYSSKNLTKWLKRY